MIKGKKKKNLFLKVGMTSSMLLFGLMMSHQTVNAEDITSNADVVLSEGIRLTAVPNFEFGKILYDGQATSSTLQGKTLGDKELSWFDGTGIPTEGIKVYATIKDIPQPGMEEANINFKVNSSGGEPTTKLGSSWFADSKGTQGHTGEYNLKFNGEKTLLVTTSNKDKYISYSEYKQQGIKEYRMNPIEKKTLTLPSNLVPMNMEATIDWDIESAP